jgi:uncharacterized protein (TIGR02001 family)
VLSALPVCPERRPGAEAALPNRQPAHPDRQPWPFSSYRFRGIDQTYGQPALQGGIDYSHESGIYVGNWNSNVNSGAGFAEGNLEMDFYGGWKKSFGDFGLDLGAIYYYYPGRSCPRRTPEPRTRANRPAARLITANSTSLRS